MKYPLLATALLLASATPLLAQAPPPKDTELRVERRTIDREDKIAKPRTNAEELTRGLHISVKNIGGKPLPEGEVEWSILVQRPGVGQKDLLSTGKEKLEPLKAFQGVTFDVGAVPVQIRGNEKQDMEYRVVVRRGEVVAAEVESKPSFEAQAKVARPMEKPEKEEKKGRKEK